ncbi:helix-turn-helix domain-containing protein [Arthrobacter sp. H14]|uniref:helix-turn-helix domain-containing protein n=1 Tax=Arthrobacter sp. H14 TaxID=1312959 RepID=UPI0004B7E0E6|nr:helix-turn-helix domain-containing protein [Arthrobacter sp. H14]
MTAKNFRNLELLTVEEVATVLRVSRMTVYRRVHSGELPSVHFGRSFRIPASAIEAYLNPRTTSTEPEEKP